MRDKPVQAWAICDLDGRGEPKPLIRHIYETETVAKSTADYCGFSPEFYQVHQVEITLAGTQKKKPASRSSVVCSALPEGKRKCPPNCRSKNSDICALFSARHGAAVNLIAPEGE